MWVGLLISYVANVANVTKVRPSKSPKTHPKIRDFRGPRKGRLWILPTLKGGGRDRGGAFEHMIFRTFSSEMPYSVAILAQISMVGIWERRSSKEYFVVASFALLVNLRLHNSQICYTQNVIFLINGNRFAYFDAILVMKS